MNYNKIFWFLSLVLVTLSNNCMNHITVQQELNNRFVKAAYDGDFDKVQTLFAQGAQINGENKFGNTALMNIALKKNIEIFNFLIENNATVNATDKYQRTALNLAIHNQYEIAKLLIKHAKINLDHMTKDDVTYLTQAAYEYSFPLNCNTDKATERSNQLLGIIELLLEYGANPITPADKNGNTFIDYVNKFLKIKEVYNKYMANQAEKKIATRDALNGLETNMPNEIINLICDYL